MVGSERKREREREGDWQTEADEDIMEVKNESIFEENSLNSPHCIGVSDRSHSRLAGKNK